jgi:hypothetical protein
MIKAALHTKIMLAWVCFGLGWSAWWVWGGLLVTNMETEVPICFYNAEQRTISAPETCRVTLVGKRNELLRLGELAWHIDAKGLQPGGQTMAPTAEQLFLPPAIKLVHCMPRYVTVTIS